MKRISIITMLIVIVTMFIGCSARYNNIQPVRINNLDLEPLKSSEYEIVNDITGTATVTSVLIFRVEGENRSGFLSSNLKMESTLDLAKGNAIYNAINNNEDIDALLCPKFTKESNGIPLLYNKTTVTVKGKGIRIK